MTEDSIPRRYFLKWGEDGHWAEVSRDEFAEAERVAEMKPDRYTLPGELATGGFGAFNFPPGVWVEGRIVDRGSKPETYDIDPEFRDLVWPPSQRG